MGPLHGDADNEPATRARTCQELTNPTRFRQGAECMGYKAPITYIRVGYTPPLYAHEVPAMCNETEVVWAIRRWLSAQGLGDEGLRA